MVYESLNFSWYIHRKRKGKKCQIISLRMKKLSFFAVASTFLLRLGTCILTPRNSTLLFQTVVCMHAFWRHGITGNSSSVLLGYGYCRLNFSQILDKMVGFGKFSFFSSSFLFSSNSSNLGSSSSDKAVASFKGQRNIGFHFFQRYLFLQTHS